MNPVVHTVLWLFGIFLSVHIVFGMVGVRLMLTYFPEAQKWWREIVQLLALAFFALIVLLHPF